MNKDGTLVNGRGLSLGFQERWVPVQQHLRDFRFTSILAVVVLFSITRCALPRSESPRASQRSEATLTAIRQLTKVRFDSGGVTLLNDTALSLHLNYAYINYRGFFGGDFFRYRPCEYLRHEPGIRLDRHCLEIPAHSERILTHTDFVKNDGAIFSPIATALTC